MNSTNFSYFFYGHYGYPLSTEESPGISVSTPSSPKDVPISGSTTSNSPVASTASIESEPAVITIEVKNRESGSPLSQDVRKIDPIKPGDRQTKQRATADKTSFCFNSIEGKCRRNCGRAHHSDELIPVPVNPRYKTMQCHRFNCFFGENCDFQHNDELVQRKGNTITVSKYNRYTGSYHIYRKGYININ